MARRVMYTPNLVQSGKPVILVMWSHRQHTSGSKRIVNRATTKLNWKRGRVRFIAAVLKTADRLRGP